MKNIAVIGAGSWGTAIASLLDRKGEYKVTLWVREETVLNDILEFQENRTFLPGIRLSERINAVSSLEEAVTDASVVVNVVPSKFVRNVFSRLATYIGMDVDVVTASKGIEDVTLKTIYNVLKEVLPEHCLDRISVLSGPSFAKEVASGLPAAVCIASDSAQVSLRTQRIFSSHSFRVYRSSDVVGVELGGVLKNVIAIAAGISDGLELGANARAALITRGLSEISRLGVAMGGKAMTFYGLSGLGDLILTCTGDLSRNRSVGVSIGRGVSLDSLVSGMKTVAEGVSTARSAYMLSQEHGISMPITEKVYQVVEEGKSPKCAVMELMQRELTEE